MPTSARRARWWKAPWLAATERADTYFYTGKIGSEDGELTCRSR